ncbi:adhesion G protein-coupled receptor E2 isoform X2 [Esox lucius]|uniref:adhesion G protein-coupled receptor E2 isoform X2 n=1 Tax=Esox lucius TaxID=8010 RepID=UPI0014773656|nr:adhesion G protein-coupled receptor E2 isoform X2 [Esox lucius]
MDKCEDINECNPGVCPKGKCVNTLGSYYCQCDPGMRYDANGSCVDVDECTAHPQICGEDSTCLNTNGSYSCHCLPGFKSNIGLCFDINECVEEKRYCGNEGLCHNLIGSYWCQCSPGSTNYGQNGTKCVELSCDPQEARPGKTLPGLGNLMSLVRKNCLSLRNSSMSGPSGPPLGGDVLLKELINATDLVQLNHQNNSGPHGGSDVTSFLEAVENFIRLIAPQLTEKTARIETNYTEANILVNRNKTQPTGPVSLTSENAQLDTTWETAVGDQNNYPGFAFVSLVSFKNVHILNGNSSQTQQLISNAVIVSTGNPNSTNLNQPINLTFHHLEVAPFKMFADKDPDCVYWSEENGAWSRQGCNLVITNATHTLCSCNHLSTFSLLKGLQQEKVMRTGGQLSRVMWAGILVALACVVLSLTLTLLCRFASRRRHRGRNHLDVKFFRK